MAHKLSLRFNKDYKIVVKNRVLQKQLMYMQIILGCRSQESRRSLYKKNSYFQRLWCEKYVHLGAHCTAIRLKLKVVQ